MKKFTKFTLIALLLVAVLLSTAPAFALDLTVYGGKYFDAVGWELPGTNSSAFVAGVDVKESFLYGHLDPYLKFETLMDQENSGNALGVAGSFHPTSIKYTAGLDIPVYDGFGIRLEHMCWHSMGVNYWSAPTEQYSLVSLFYKIHVDTH